MVERYLTGMSQLAVARAVERAARAAEAMSTEGGEVRYLGSTYVPSEESCFCRFEAPDAEAVRAVNERARLPYWRIVDAVFMDYQDTGFLSSKPEEVEA